MAKAMFIRAFDRLQKEVLILQICNVQYIEFRARLSYKVKPCPKNKYDKSKDSDNFVSCHF